MNPPHCKICAEYWLNEGRPMGNYLIVSRGGHIPGAHDSAPDPGRCKECTDYWVKEGRPRDHYLIISEGGHIPGVHDPSSTSERTRAEAAGTSEVPESNAQVNELSQKLSINESGKEDQIAQPGTGSTRQ